MHCPFKDTHQITWKWKILMLDRYYKTSAAALVHISYNEATICVFSPENNVEILITDK